MAFRVGQLVAAICNGADSPELRRGHIYSIREVCGEVLFFEGMRAAVKVDEIIRFSGDAYWHDFPFSAESFRPLTRRNIEIVEALKAPPPEQVEPLSPLEVAFQ